MIKDSFRPSYHNPSKQAVESWWDKRTLPEYSRARDEQSLQHALSRVTWVGWGFKLLPVGLGVVCWPLLWWLFVWSENLSINLEARSPVIGMAMIVTFVLLSLPVAAAFVCWHTYDFKKKKEKVSEVFGPFSHYFLLQLQEMLEEMKKHDSSSLWGDIHHATQQEMTKPMFSKFYWEKLYHKVGEALFVYEEKMKHNS